MFHFRQLIDYLNTGSIMVQIVGKQVNFSTKILQKSCIKFLLVTKIKAFSKAKKLCYVSSYFLPSHFLKALALKSSVVNGGKNSILYILMWKRIENKDKYSF